MDVFFSEFPSVAVPHFKGFNVAAFWQLRFLKHVKTRREPDLKIIKIEVKTAIFINITR